MRTTFSRKVIFLSSIGFSIGVVFCVLLTSILTTYGINDGTLYVCAPDFIEAVGNPILALFIEMIVSGLLGAVCWGLTAVYDIEEWSILKSTFIHYVISMAAYFSVAFTLRWLSPKDPGANLLWFLILTAGYTLIWAVNYIIYRFRIAKINSELKAFKDRSI
ncbi:MAG: DUF3021 domain-containing protein [Lachnospiraceae bacterium]|nr:DUF3021 domain-containing protein [Lachnospiraceae bacterium]